MRRWYYAVLLLSILLTGCGSASELTPGPSVRIETGVNSDAWALVPAGTFYFDQHAHPTEVDYDFEIMVTDVTNTQYADYLNQALAEGWVEHVGDTIQGYYQGDVFHGFKHEQPIEAGDWLHVPLDDPGLRLFLDGKSFKALPEYENHPMVMVTWFGAKGYCEFYNWRLPTEIEWEKAARGEDARPYPWGEKIEPSNANYYSSHDIFEKIFGKLGDTTPVGFYSGRSYDNYATTNSPSPYGLYDMAGNVWQWTADDYEDQHYRYMRGGSKADYAYNLRVWTRNSAVPDYFSPNVGFRCARDMVD
jgi:formylglycine-generating enzyme required for sulfatase activity